MFMFAIISSDPSPQQGTNMGNFSLFFLFVIANRGSVDGIVWFMLHDLGKIYNKVDGLNRLEDEDIEVSSKQIQSDSSIDDISNDEDDILLQSAHDIDRRKKAVDQIKHIVHDVDEMGKKIGKNIENKMTNTLTKLADLAIAEFDETDMSPQVNMALRQQIVQYVTMGVNNSVLKQNIDVNSICLFFFQFCS
jgi:hypothetical protein